MSSDSVKNYMEEIFRLFFQFLALNLNKIFNKLDFLRETITYGK